MKRNNQNRRSARSDSDCYETDMSKHRNRYDYSEICSSSDQWCSAIGTQGTPLFLLCKAFLHLLCDNVNTSFQF